MPKKLKQLLWALLQPVLQRIYGHWCLQPVFKRLHRIALSGMHMGGDGLVSTSGELWILDMLARVLSPDAQLTIADVGANSGDFTAAVRAAFGNRAMIYAFEPAHATYATLAARFAGDVHVRTFAYGLGAADATVTLYGDKVGSGWASVVQRQIGSTRLTPQETVALRSLDEVCREQNIAHIHFLKLDVEGHEFAVLTGTVEMLRAAAIDVIQFEFGGTDIDARIFLRDFFSLLTPQYLIYRIVRNGLAPVRRYTEAEEIFVLTNFLAVRQGIPLALH